MRIILTLNYHRLDHLAPLFIKLYERYANGSVWFEEIYGEIRPIIDVQPHELSQDDRDFLNSLQKEHLISHWLRGDPL